MAGKKQGRLKKPKLSQGRRLHPTDTPNYDENPPIFSLRRVDGGKYCFLNLSQEDRAAFAHAIFKRRSISWKEIKSQNRHALGFEKISKGSINPDIPRNITDEVDHFLAFRYNGKKSMVGYRFKDIFFVIWFDHDFTLYDH